jgi:RNA polymerase sigma factor (sigma-70 family)
MWTCQERISNSTRSKNWQHLSSISFTTSLTGSPRIATKPKTWFRKPTWIYRILRNTFLTSRKGLKVAMTVPLDFDEQEGPEPAIERDTPETLLLARSSHELLQKALDELPVHFREILLLCEVEEMSYQEISETLAVPIGTVMSRLSRARQTLRSQLRPQLQQEAAPRIAKGTNHGL